MEVIGQHHAPTALAREGTRYAFYRELGGPQGRSWRFRNRRIPERCQYSNSGQEVEWLEGLLTLNKPQNKGTADVTKTGWADACLLTAPVTQQSWAILNREHRGRYCNMMATWMTTVTFAESCNLLRQSWTWQTELFIQLMAHQIKFGAVASMYGYVW